MLTAKLLGVRTREGKNRDGNPQRYFNADLYTEAGSGQVMIDEGTYRALERVPMGTVVEIVPRWSVFNGRAELRVESLVPVAKAAEGRAA